MSLEQSNGTSNIDMPYIPQQSNPLANAPETGSHSKYNQRKILEDLKQYALAFAKYEESSAKRTDYENKAILIEEYLETSEDPTYGDFISLTEDQQTELLQQSKLRKAYQTAAKNTGKLGVAPLVRY